MKRLAVTISGAVSLGAYEAGVLYEMLQALTAHNAANDGDDSKQIQIDVLTGASAGGMSAAILAPKLLFQPSRLSEEQDNDLYLPWVRDVDLAGLLKTAADEPSDHSILSSDLVERVANRYLVDPYADGLNMRDEPPHPAAARKIMLGMALSNLNGVDYGLGLSTGGQMPYTRFQDQLIIPIDSNDPACDSADFWRPIQAAAVSCGAFPFAFRVKELLRHATEYSNPAPITPLAGTTRFAYTDGGTFQNEPIALAKRLVDTIDDHTFPDRHYLFIAPAMRNSAHNNLLAADASYIPTAKALVNAVFNQARYRDLQDVERINSRIRSLDLQATGLKDLFVAGSLDVATTRPAVRPVLRLLFAAADDVALQANRIYTDALTRLAAQYAEELKAVTDARGAVAGQAWLEGVLMLETVANLGPKDTMRVYAITDDAEDLAGAGMFAFAGFFDQSYRQHDYDRGRKSARAFVRWLNGAARAAAAEAATAGKQPDPSLGPIDYDVDAMDKQFPIVLDPKLSNLKMQDIPVDRRRVLRDRLLARADDIMKAAGIPWAGREVIQLGFLNRFFDRMLGL